MQIFCDIFFGSGFSVLGYRLSVKLLSILRPRDWFEIVSGLSRDWLGSLSQKFRLELGRNWFEISSRFSRDWLGEVGER